MSGSTEGERATGLDALFPAPRVVALRDGPVEVLPVPIGRLSAFARAAEPVWECINAADFMGLIRRDAEAAISVVAIGTGLPEARIRTLLPDEFLRLAAAVVEANMDFFGRAVLPEATATMLRLAAAVTALRATVGPASSPGSSSADTASATSGG